MHIVFWLLKDFAWIIQFRAFGLLMAVLTFVLSVCNAKKFIGLFLQIRHKINSPDETVNLDCKFCEIPSRICRTGLTVKIQCLLGKFTVQY